MKLQKAIEKTKLKLINRAKKNGIYENFGQKEILMLEDKYIDITKYTDDMNNNRALLNNFNNWCMTYNGGKK